MGKGKTLILGLLCGCFMVGCSNTTKEKQLAATILCCEREDRFQRWGCYC